VSTGRVILIGAALGLVAVGVAAALVLTGVLGPLRPSDAPVDGPVLVALVLPNETGVLQPQVIDVYSRTTNGWAVRSVSPTLPAVVSGTSGSTLADAYSFGGGSALAKAYSQLGRGSATSWVVVDPSGWSRLASSTSLPFNLPAHLEVFDGSQLVAFQEGSGTVAPSQLALLFDGTRYLPAGESAAVRTQAGDLLGSELRNVGVLGVSGVVSDLPPRRLATWLRGLGAPARLEGD